MNASAITAIRTAAVSGVATRLLAREDARELAIVGAGHQAHPHIAAMLEARPFERDPHRRPHSRERRAARRRVAVGDGGRLERGGGARRRRDLHGHAARASRCSRYGWLKPGAHINAVGACLPHARELDSGDGRALARSSPTGASRARTRRATTSSPLAEGAIPGRAHQGGARRGARRARTRAARRTTRSRSSSRSASRSRTSPPPSTSSAGPRRRAPARRSTFDPARRDRGRARPDRGGGGADAAGAAARHRHLAEAGEPAAGVVVQDPRGDERDPSRLARTT